MTPLFERAGAGEGAPAGRSREGQRHRHDLHVRRSHRRDLVARAVAAGARRDPVRTARSSRWRSAATRGRRATPPRAQAAYDQLAGLSAAKARTRIVELLRESRRSGGRPAPDHAPGEVLREGRPAARDRHQPPVVRQDDGFPRRAAGARPRAAVAPGVHGAPVRELGERAVGRLVRQPAAVLRRAVSGVVPDREDGTIDYAQPLLPDEAQLPIDPSTDTPGGYRPDQRDQPGGFAGDPDIMDTWATSSLTPHVAGGWLKTRRCSRRCSRWTCGRRRTTSSAPGSSPRCCARSSSTARCRGATRRSPAGCSTPTARRCRSRRGTS